MELMYMLYFSKTIKIADEEVEAVGVFESKEDAEAWYKENEEYLSQFDSDDEVLSVHIEPIAIMDDKAPEDVEENKE